MKMVRCFLSLVLFFFLSMSATQLFAVDWQPIAKEDLALKDNVLAPGSKAMILYRYVERDDMKGSQTDYVRIKIFTEEGKSYGDITIPPLIDHEYKVTSVEGRTIHPDGTIVPFNGQVFEKFVQHGKDKVSAKSFTLPDITPGSIIEYKYTMQWAPWYGWSGLTEWFVQSDLFQRTAHFQILPASSQWFSYKAVANHLPKTAKMAQDKKTRIVTLDIDNLPPYVEEPYMPPSNDETTRVLFFYSRRTILDGDAYWKEQAKYWYDDTEQWLDKKGATSKALKSISEPADSTDVRLHKIYDYLQTFPNLSFRDEKSEKELKRAKEKDNKDVEDVLKNKYGYRTEINRAFVALARAAGVDATLVRLTERSEDVLHKEWPYFYQMRWELAVLRMNGKMIFLDPGTPYCPYGILPWEATGVTALLLDKNGPTWVETPVPPASDATIKRSAKLALAEDGSLSGDVEVTFSGIDAEYRRLAERNADDAAKKKGMEDLLQDWLPSKADIQYLGANDWRSSNQPLVLRYKVSMQDYASTTGHRMLLPATVFSAAYKNPFVATRRFNAIEMACLSLRSDDVTIVLPAGLKVESLPKAAEEKSDAAIATATYANENGSLHFTRTMELKQVFINVQQYASLRQYYQKVQSEANEEAVLEIAK